MADVVIDNSIWTGFDLAHGPRRQVWISSSVGYEFFLDDVGGIISVLYKKSTDSGATWGSRVTVISKASSGHECVSVWYDRWTPGDTGTLVHVATRDGASDALLYRSLDTSSDTLGTLRTAATGVTLSSVASTVQNESISITKSVGADIHIAYRLTTAASVHCRSTDGGVNWTTPTDFFEGAVNDLILLFPANTDDSDDIAALYWDDSASAISIKIWDAGGDTIAETAVASSMDFDVTSPSCIQWGAAMRHSDKAILLVATTDTDSATADAKTWQIAPGNGSGGTVTVTAKTNVLTDTNEVGPVSLAIDQNTDDVYVTYAKGGTWGTSVTVYYVKSTDDMGTWGTETTLSDSAGNYTSVDVCISTASGDSGRFAPSWLTNGTDVSTNATNSVAITTGGGAPTTRRYSLSLTGVG